LPDDFGVLALLAPLVRRVEKMTSGSSSRVAMILRRDRSEWCWEKIAL